ncbi:MAG: FxsA family protein [Hyphomicrobiales bacterium]
MRLGPVILFLFIAIPIAEIWILIEVGGIIGVVPTITLVVLTAIAGTALIRHQGMSLLIEARQRLDRGEPPVSAVVDGAFLLVAGALLLTPGFITDAIGFLCLVPFFRRSVAAWLWSRYGNRADFRQSGFSGPGPRQNGTSATIIEGEFTEVDPGDVSATLPGHEENSGSGNRPDGRSPWAGKPPRD